MAQKERTYSLKVAFFRSDKTRERVVADAFIAGINKYGDRGIIISDNDLKAMRGMMPAKTDIDVAVIMGISRAAKRYFEEFLAAGRHIVYLDKGLTRHGDDKYGNRLPKYYRVSVDAFQATEYFMKKDRLPDRWEALGYDIKPWQEVGPDGHIVVAGGSEKYSFWHQHEGGATGWAWRVIDEVRKYTKRPIIYRPKPSWAEAVPIKGTRFSRPPTILTQELSGCHALITFGSNSAVTAICQGVPAFVLGDGLAKPMSLADLAKIETPYYPSDEERARWARCLAYCQWSLDEMTSGEAWKILREEIK